MKQIIHIFLGVLLAANISAQINSRVICNTDSIGIGDIVQVYVELSSSTEFEVQAIDYSVFNRIQSLEDIQAQDSFEYFAELEWIDPAEDQLVNRTPQLQRTNRASLFLDTLTFRIWDSGSFMLPHPELMRNDSTTRVQLFQNPVVRVGLPANIINPDTTSMILPIKDIIREHKTITDYLWILYGLLALLVVYAVYYLIRKRSKPKIEEELEEVILPAHMIADRKLGDLRKLKLWESGSIKEFQTQLTFIIREYLENRFSVKALESTTDEIRRDLAKTQLSQEQITELIEILQIADLVKFAKAQPPLDINEVFLNRADEFVSQTKRAYTKEQEDQIIMDYEIYIKKLKSRKS